MRRLIARALPAVMLAALLAQPAIARQTAAPAYDAPANSAQQALYQEALQALADGRKTDASAALTQLIEREPLHAGAWLDLALIQCGLGNADEAERLFANVETRFNPSPDILLLISEARDAGCKQWQPVSSSSVMLGRGIDQNVNQGPSTSTFLVERGGRIELPLQGEFLPQHDQYALLSADFMREITPNGSLGFAQYQMRRHDHLRQYDSASLFAGVESPWRFGGWVVRTTGMLGAVSLGGHIYQRQAQLQARVTPPLPLPANTQFNLMGAAGRTAYQSLVDFDASTFELRGQLTHRRGEWFTSASVGMLSDHARGNRPGANRHGTFTNLLVRKRLPWETTGELGYTRQTWNGATPYSPELLIDQVRDQATHVLRGALFYPLARNHSLQLEARLVRNRENISIFQYNNKQLQLSWQWQHP